MSKAELIIDGVWLVGGPNISMSEDATVFVIDFSGELIMIDTGAGRSARTLVRNIEGAGLDPKKISTVILTHCHIDHIGAAPLVPGKFRLQTGRPRQGCRRHRGRRPHHDGGQLV